METYGFNKFVQLIINKLLKSVFKSD